MNIEKLIIRADAYATAHAHAVVNNKPEDIAAAREVFIKGLDMLDVDSQVDKFASSYMNDLSEFNDVLELETALHTSETYKEYMDKLSGNARLAELFVKMKAGDLSDFSPETIQLAEEASLSLELTHNEKHIAHVSKMVDDKIANYEKDEVFDPSLVLLAEKAISYLRLSGVHQPKTPFNDPRVQIVLETLNDLGDFPPTAEPQEHWDGWISRRIVDKLYEQTDAQLDTRVLMSHMLAFTKICLHAGDTYPENGWPVARVLIALYRYTKKKEIDRWKAGKKKGPRPFSDRLVNSNALQFVDLMQLREIQKDQSREEWQRKTNEKYRNWVPAKR